MTAPSDTGRLRELLERVSDARRDGALRAIENDLIGALSLSAASSPSGMPVPTHKYFTGSLSAVTILAEAMLPLWWISSGRSACGPHASCGPDPRAFEIACAWGEPPPPLPVGLIGRTFDVAFDHPMPEAYARLAAVLKAMIALREASV